MTFIEARISLRCRISAYALRQGPFAFAADKNSEDHPDIVTPGRDYEERAIDNCGGLRVNRRHNIPVEFYGLI